MVVMILLCIDYALLIKQRMVKGSLRFFQSLVAYKKAQYLSGGRFVA